MQVSKWGNSLAIRIPAEVVEELRLKAGDEIVVRTAGPAEFAIERKPTRKELVERVRKLATALPSDFKFDREEANARR